MNVSFLQYAGFGALIAAAFALAISGSKIPWMDLDKLVGTVVKQWFSRIHGEANTPSVEAWEGSAVNRVRLLKYAVFGVVLVSLFPLHNLVNSDGLIDTLWHAVLFVRVQLNQFFPTLFGADGHDWRESPYELWEICVLFWTITVLTNVVVDDFLEIKRLSGPSDDPKHLVAMGSRATIFKQILVVVGSCVLVILNSGLLRLAFELFIIMLLLGFDLRFCVGYANLGRQLNARQFSRMIVLVDIPVAFAFVLLILFLRSENLSQFESHWTTPFVAGAAALNLLLTSGIVLILKAIHSYEQEVEIASKRATALAVAGGGIHAQL